MTVEHPLHFEIKDPHDDPLTAFVDTKPIAWLDENTDQVVAPGKVAASNEGLEKKLHRITTIGAAAANWHLVVSAREGER